MKIVVIGGSGLIGRQLVRLLENDGYEVITASPATGIDILTGEGLRDALQDTEVVVDVSNPPSSTQAGSAAHFFKTGNSNLLPAEKVAEVRHHIASSIVGTTQLGASEYFRGKQIQEELVKISGIPYTIVQSTQFFEFAEGIFQMGQVGDKISLPRANVQPISSLEVAAFLAETILNRPLDQVLEIAGPEKFSLTEWISQYARATRKQILVETDLNALYAGSPLSGDTLVPVGANYLGKATYSGWIKKTVKR